MAKLVDVMMLVTLDLPTRTGCVKKVGGFAGARLDSSIQIWKSYLSNDDK